MLYPFVSDGFYDVGISEIKIIDGIKQIRVMKEEPNRETGHFKIVNFLLPSKKILNSKGLGWQIINSLVNQMDGNYEITNKKGIGFILIFPIN